MHKAQDPKSCASTSSATLAYFLIINSGLFTVKKGIKKYTKDGLSYISLFYIFYFLSSNTAVQWGQRVALSAISSQQKEQVRFGVSAGFGNSLFI